jgi:3-(3-hydroxy-phenyl)propionate hydroxylase
VTAEPVEVLVVGAGPTGLFTACELIRRGVRVRIIDRAAEPAAVPRALALWPRALEILQDLDIDEELRSVSIPIAAAGYFSGGRPLATFAAPDRLRPRHLPQYETERLLTERLHRLGGKVERGVRLVSFEDGDGRTADPVTAALEHGDTGVTRVRADYVIGADGASSTVRGLLGIGFHGSTYELAFALIDTHVTGRLPADRLLYYQAAGGTLMIAPLPDGVFRILAVMPPNGGAVSVPMMQKLLDERGPGGVTITDPVWQTVYRVHARQATEYRRGRLFLIGDAAHVHSPAGGQGMNNGLQDGYNLAWKLAAVLSGQSPPALLDTYPAERIEATERIIADTDRQTRAWMAGTRTRIILRDTAFRLADRAGVVPRYVVPVMAGRRVRYSPVRVTQRPSGRARCHLLRRVPGRLRVGMVFPRELAVAHGIAGPRAEPAGWTVATLRPARRRDDWSARLAAITARRPGVRTVDLPASGTARATGCRRPGFYLIRPDGHIAAHGHEPDLDRLDAELALVLIPKAAEQ